MGGFRRMCTQALYWSNCVFIPLTEQHNPAELVTVGIKHRHVKLTTMPKILAGTAAVTYSGYVSIVLASNLHGKCGMHAALNDFPFSLPIQLKILSV